jgi:hypothetical protein
VKLNIQFSPYQREHQRHQSLYQFEEAYEGNQLGVSLEQAHPETEQAEQLPALAQYQEVFLVPVLLVDHHH